MRDKIAGELGMNLNPDLSFDVLGDFRSWITKLPKRFSMAAKSLMRLKLEKSMVIFMIILNKLF